MGGLLFQQTEEEDKDVDKNLYREEENDKKDIINNNEHLNLTTNKVTI